MYNEVHDKVLEGIMSVALTQIMYEEDEACPSDEELAKMYPLSKKMLRKYNKRIKEREYRNPLPVVYLKRVSIIALAVISVMFGVLSTSGEVRAAIVNTVVTWYDKYVQFDFSKTSNPVDSNMSDIPSNPEQTLKTLNDLEIEYIPEGYVLDSYTEDSYLREFVYSSADGDYLIIGLYSSDSVDVVSDIEKSEYEMITINNNTAYVLYNPQDRMGTLILGNETYTIWISAVTEKSELIKVAEKIK